MKGATPRPTLSFHSLGRPAVILTAGGLVGQVFAVICTLFVAARVGTAPELDALLVAEVGPVVIAGLLVSALRTALVPAYVEISEKHGDYDARRFVGAIITWTTLIGTCITLLLIKFPASAIAIAGPGLSHSAYATALHFQPLLAPALVFSSVATLMSALCQINERFLPIALSWAIASLTTLLVTVTSWNHLGLDGLAIGITLGHIVNLVITVTYTAKRGLLPPIAFSVSVSQLKQFLHHALPLAGGSAVLQFNLVTDRAIATMLAPGAVSVLNYGQQIILAPLASLSSAWSTVLYPMLVRVAHKPERRSLGEDTSRTLRYTIVLFVPITIVSAALAPLLVEIVYRRGVFGAQSIMLTAGVVAAFAPMLLITMIQPVLTGAHNAHRRGALLGLTAVMNAVINVVLNLAFGLSFGIAGVALSTSVTTALTLLWLASRLAHSESNFMLRPLLILTLRTAVASLMTAVPLSIIVWKFLPLLPSFVSFMVFIVTLVIAILSYLAIGRVLGITEIRNLMNGISQRVVVPRRHG